MVKVQFCIPHPGMVLSGVAEEDAVLVSLTDHSIECWGVQHCRMVRRHRTAPRRAAPQHGIDNADCQH